MVAAPQSAANAMQGLTTHRPLREELPMAASQTTKVCTKCKTEKPVDLFHKKVGVKNGLASNCKACRNDHNKNAYSKNIERERERKRRYRVANPNVDREYQAKNKERLAEHKRKYYEANSTQEKRRSSDYYYANRDEINRDRREYRRANREAESLLSRLSYAENRDRLRAQSKAWRDRNKEKVRACRSNTKAIRRSAYGRLTANIIPRLFKLQRGKCACCGKPLGDNYHLDHIMPIALGGTNTDNNVQLLRAECNHQKHAKHPVDFMRQRGFLL